MPFPDENEIHLPGGIILNGDRDGDGVLMTLATLDGWGSPGSTGGGQQRAGAHGESPAPNPKLTARTLSLTGRIDAPTILLRQQAEHRLQGALGLDLFDLTVVDAIPLRVQAQRSGQISRADDTDTQVTWQTELRCPDPQRYGTAHTLSLALPSTTGGDTWPEQWPEQFDGTTTSGDVTATNAGNIAAPSRVTFTGPLTSPSLTNFSTGQGVTYNSTLAAGEFVYIYLRTPMLALLMGTAARTGLISTSGGGGPWGVEPGSNQIAFRASAGSGTALLEYSDSFQ
jgi:hypothetical protein